MNDLNTFAITFAALAVGAHMSLGIVMEFWDRYQEYRKDKEWADKQAKWSEEIAAMEAIVPVASATITAVETIPTGSKKASKNG